MEGQQKNQQISAEIIKDRLYWISDKNPPKNQNNAYFFCIDNDLVYEPFFADFGPLNLGMTYRFITELDKLLQDQSYSKYLIYHYTSLDSSKRTNAAYLMGAFMIVIQKKTTEDVKKIFKNIFPDFADFRDASYGPCTYKCSIYDCLKGLEIAIQLKWFDIRTFNLRDYEFYERVENGDLNWIIPGKFLAFSGPSDSARDADGFRMFTPDDYVPIFKQFGVNLVVRLNKKVYDEKRFTKYAIKHMDLYFVDGSTPSDEIIDKFLEVVESQKGAVAIHCKAGLGRTGTLIALYAMKHYHFPAAAFIGWIRIARPGSILGPQQQFLNEKQAKMFELGKNSPIWKKTESMLSENNLSLIFNKLEINDNKITYTADDLKKAKFGDSGQANRLVQAKQKK